LGGNLQSTRYTAKEESDSSEEKTGLHHGGHEESTKVDICECKLQSAN
jgi:hypothetical protein